MEKEFLKVFEENKQRLIRICVFYEKNAENRKDLYQEIAYQVWRSLKSFRKESNINTWIYRIAINTAISFKRKNNKDQLNKPLENYIKLESIYNLQANTENNEIVNKVYQVIEGLNRIEQTVILLFLEGFNNKEIAGITGLSDNNIAVRIIRVKHKIKDLVEV